MSLTQKFVILGSLLAAALIALAAYVFFWLAYIPPTVQASTVGGTHIRLATVGTIDYGAEPDWVSYLIRHDGKWVHSTVWEVPANSTIHVTVDEYDTQTGLRNPFLSMVRGTLGGVEVVNGTPVRYVNPNYPAHTFSVPELGVNVPLVGISNSSYPGDLTNPHNDHVTITFSFRTYGPETVHWQCFVPCAAGYLYGNGGPMQTVGYMDGYIKIVPKSQL